MPSGMGLGWSFEKNANESVSTSSQTPELELISWSGWNESVYLDTDVVLAFLKVDDGLAPTIDRSTLETPVTSTATAIEVQYVMQDEWDRTALSTVHSAIAEEGVDFAPLDEGTLEAAGTLRMEYESVGIFDSIHLGTALTLDEVIVSTDSLYPSITEIDHIDPRNIDR